LGELDVPGMMEYPAIEKMLLSCNSVLLDYFMNVYHESKFFLGDGNGSLWKALEIPTITHHWGRG
jgi:hypothetical protein